MDRSVFRNVEENLKKGIRQQITVDAGGETYTRQFVPYQRLILLGGGHVSQALCNFAAELDFEVVVVDDRLAFANERLFPKASRIICDHFEKAIEELQISSGDYIAVLTRGHRWDQMCLEKIFQGTMPSYLGLIGSKRRVSGLFDLMEENGYSRELMDRVSTPIGIPINASTPKEIGISILAELIKFRQSEADSREVLTLKNVDPNVFDAVEKNDRAVMALVLDIRGSVPVDTGALMIVNGTGRCAGTVGGGCGEQEVITEARRVLVTGEADVIDLDMTNEVAENNGMVCGGTMKVLIDVIEDNDKRVVQ